MRSDSAIPLKLAWLIYGLLWTGGALRLPDPGGAAPGFLFLAGVIALLSNPGEWKALLGAAATGFAAEWIGLTTGFPFGAYVYTGKLGPAVLGVPLAIAVAWMVLFAFVRQLTSNRWIAAGLLMGCDLLIDPVASGTLGYWKWLQPGPYFGVPLTNFAGWYLVSALMMLVFNKRKNEPNWSQRILGVSILLFFAAQAI